MNPIVHSFSTSLAKSMDPKITAALDRIYRHEFGQTIGIHRYDGRSARDLSVQRLGIDLAILLPDGQTLITVEEKIRFRKFDDILVEIISNDRTQKPGWAFTFQADYLMYYRTPLPKHYGLYNRDPFKRTVAENIKTWKNRYQIITAKNEGYNTISVAIPIPVFDEVYNLYL